jgi:hypothetical protein
MDGKRSLTKPVYVVADPSSKSLGATAVLILIIHQKRLKRRKFLSFRSIPPLKSKAFSCKTMNEEKFFQL